MIKSNVIILILNNTKKSKDISDIIKKINKYTNLKYY